MSKSKLLEHNMVPHHEIIEGGEAEDLLEKYNIKKEQLPKIRSDDPIILEIGAIPGDIIKITRNSHTAGEALYYRLVIETLT